MGTKSRTPFNFGDWVYLIEEVDQHPVGTYGKVEFFPKLQQVQIKSFFGEMICVPTDKIKKLSVEQIGSTERQFMLIEPSNGVPARTRVHLCSVSDEQPVFLTSDGKKIQVDRKNLMLVIEHESDNPIVWTIQQS